MAGQGGDTPSPAKGLSCRVSSIIACYVIAVGALVPGMLLAQHALPRPPAKQQGKPVPIPTPTSDPEGDKPIVSDKDFNAALPKLSDDINAPLEPIPQDAPFTPQTADSAPDSATAPAPVVEPRYAPAAARAPAELASLYRRSTATIPRQ